MTVTTTVDDNGVALLTFDDGGKNVLSLESIAALADGLDLAAGAKAVVIAGREGALSAGLDLKHVQEHGPAGARELIAALGVVAMRIWGDPRPTVCAATGHAIAGGTILAMAHDHVVASAGHWKWGLTETRVNLEVPDMGLELVTSRLAPKDVNTYVLPGTPVDAAMAVAIGYADELAELEDTVARAVSVATERAELPAGAYAGNKARLRTAAIERVRERAAKDLLEVTRHLDS